jgi:NADH-quinone oxidoreductase subunit G
VAAKDIVKPSAIAHSLAGVAVALARRLEKDVPAFNVSPTAAQQAIAASLASGKRVAVLLGDLALCCSDASQIEAHANLIATLLDGSCGRLSLSGATTACYIAGATPSAGATTAHQALTGRARAFVLVGCEPERDSAAGAQALQTLSSAEKVVCLTSFASEAMKSYADVLLPISPFTETSGTYVSQDGTVQSFTGVVRPLGETRPGWKVLRVLGDLLGAGVDSFNSSEDVKAIALGGFSAASLGIVPCEPNLRTLDPDATGEVERVADVPIYHADPLVRRSHSLSLSAYGKQGQVRLSAYSAQKLGFGPDCQVRVTQSGSSIVAALTIDDTVLDGTVRIPLATGISAALGDASAAITMEAA